MADDKKDSLSVGASLGSSSTKSAVSGAGAKVSAAGKVTLSSNSNAGGGIVNKGAFSGPVAPAGQHDLQQETFGKAYTDVARGLAQALGQDRWANRDNLEAQQAQENQFVQQIIDHGKATILPGGFSTDGMNKSQDPIKLGTGKTGGAGVSGAWDGLPTSDLRPKNGGTSKQSEFGPWDWSQGAMNRAAGINKASQDLRAQNATWPGMVDKIYQGRDIQNQRMAEAKANDFVHAFAPRVADASNPGAYTPTPPSHYYDVKPSATGDLEHLQNNVTEFNSDDSGIAKHDPYSKPMTSAQRLDADTTFSPWEKRAINEQLRPQTMDELAPLWAQQLHRNDPRPNLWKNGGQQDDLFNPFQAAEARRAAHPLRNIPGMNNAHPLRDNQAMGQGVPQGFMPELQLHGPDGVFRGVRAGAKPIDNERTAKQIGMQVSGADPIVLKDDPTYGGYSQISGVANKLGEHAHGGFLTGVFNTFMGGLTPGKQPKNEMDRVNSWLAGNRINQDIDPVIEANFLKAALDKANSLQRRDNKVGVSPVQQGDTGPVAPSFSIDQPHGKYPTSDASANEMYLRGSVLRKTTPQTEGPPSVKTMSINDSVQHAFTSALDMYKNAIRSAGNDSGFRGVTTDKNNNIIGSTRNAEERRQRIEKQRRNNV